MSQKINADFLAKIFVLMCTEFKTSTSQTSGLIWIKFSIWVYFDHISLGKFFNLFDNSKFEGISHKTKHIISIVTNNIQRFRSNFAQLSLSSRKQNAI